MPELLKAFTPRKAGQLLVVCLLAVVMLGAGDDSARFGRIGHRMMCVCGCGQILLECNHVGCPDSARMIGELHNRIGGPGSDSGGGDIGGSGGGLGGTLSDTTIMNWFVAKYGATVLAAPMRGGFDNVAWIVPITVFLLATIGTALLVKLWSQRRSIVVVNAPRGSYEVDDATRARIRRETEY